MVGHGVNETECNSSEAKEGVGSMELVSQVVVISHMVLGTKLFCKSYISPKPLSQLSSPVLVAF